jgi:hypothetical protein
MATVVAPRSPRLTMLAHVVGALELLLLALSCVVAWRFVAGLGLFIVGAGGTGWLLASRVPRNPLGWMLQLSVGCFLLAFLCFVLGDLTVGLSPVLTAWLG